MRKVIVIISSIGIAITVAGLFIKFAGESYYLQQLPAELRTPEALQLTDGVACLGCEIFGGTVALYGITILLSLLFALMIYAFTRRARKLV